MLTLTDIKAGKKILWQDEPYIVLEYQHSFIGRGGAVMRTKLKNLLSGAIIDYTFHDKDKFEEAEVIRSTAQYLYHENGECQFMDSDTYEQFGLSDSVIGDGAKYLVEGTEIEVSSWNGKPISAEIPVKMTFKVVEAPPGLKGDTASGGDKVVTLENGLQITTPLFINAGDTIVVNTEKGAYVSRA